MARIDKILEKMRGSRASLRFGDVVKVCDYFFGPARQNGTSHRVYAMPWKGDPRVNIQQKNGRVKPYQVRQILAAVDKLVSSNKLEANEKGAHDADRD